jgi:glycosyltransferase involved in cell wall biosynthesis
MSSTVKKTSTSTGIAPYGVVQKAQGRSWQPEAPRICTVITVVRNGAETIEKAILSVISQAGVDIEYIVIDGGSNDGTVDIIQKYSDRIAYWVSEPDSGIYAAMNKGLALAKGQVVGILNADDWYAPGVAQLAFSALSSNPQYGYCYGWLALMDWQGEQIGLMRPVPPALFAERILRELVLPHPTLFVKKSVYDHFGSFDASFRLAADFELLARFHQAGVRGCEIPQVMAHFRIGGASMNPLILVEKRKVAIAYGRTPVRAWLDWLIDRCAMEVRRVAPGRVIGMMRSLKQRYIFGIKS